MLGSLSLPYQCTVSLRSRRSPLLIRVPQGKEGLAKGMGEEEARKVWRSKEGMWCFKLGQAFGVGEEDEESEEGEGEYEEEDGDV